MMLQSWKQEDNGICFNFLGYIHCIVEKECHRIGEGGKKCQALDGNMNALRTQIHVYQQYHPIQMIR